MDAKTEIRQRIRAALSDVPAGERPEDVPVPRDYARSRELDVLSTFVARVADYQATATAVDEAGLPAAIAGHLSTVDAASLVVPAGIPDSWLAGLSTVDVQRDDPPLPVERLDGAGAVLTGAAVGIAETGTVVLDGGARQGRRALSLVPDVHLCVVLAEQVVGTVPEAVARLDHTRPCTWISGPSATSDIELSRVEGVHGPRTLHVLLVTSSRL